MTVLSRYNPSPYCACCPDPRKARRTLLDHDEAELDEFPEERELTMRELLALEGESL